MDLEAGSLDLSKYPSSWAEFVGQDDAKATLQVAARSSAARKVAMGHTLIASPVSGIGKTTLALLTSIELGVTLHVHGGPIKESELPYLFMDMKDRDILFLDEVHRLVQGGKHNAEWLLHLLADGVYPTSMGMERAPDITVIAATTDAGRLPAPVLERFEVKPELHPYNDEDGARIVLAMAQKVLVKDQLMVPTADVARQLARAGNNSPRLIRRLLCAVRDLVWAEMIEEANGDYDVPRVLKMVGVTEDGLSSNHRRYLKVLFADYRGNAAGEKVLADRVGEVGTGLKELERILLDKGFIELTPRGRRLTPAGVRRTRDLIAEGLA